MVQSGSFPFIEGQQKSQRMNIDSLKFIVNKLFNKKTI